MTSDRTPGIYHSRLLTETGIVPERVDLITWYSERLGTFGEMTVEKANATDGKNWKAEMDGEEVKEIVGAFFTVDGAAVTRYKPDGEVDFPWLQPMIRQAETRLVMPTREGDVEIQISGLVGVARDEANNVLLTLAQEPAARTPKRVLFRTPLQTSATKFLDLLNGQREKDPNLYDLLARIGGGTDIRAMFGGQIIDSFPLPYADANRIDSANFGFAITVTDPDLRETLKNNGANRWCNPAEVRETMRAGLLNGHTAAAIFASTSLIK